MFAMYFLVWTSNYLFEHNHPYMSSGDRKAGLWIRIHIHVQIKTDELQLNFKNCKFIQFLKYISINSIISYFWAIFYDFYN